MDQDADNRDTPMSVLPYDTNPRYRALMDERHVAYRVAERMSEDTADGLQALVRMPRPMTVEEWDTVWPIDGDFTKEDAARSQAAREDLLQADLVEEVSPGSGTYQPTRLGAAVALAVLDLQWDADCPV